MQKSSNKKNAIVSILLIAAIAITGAFAYLTATDTATNLFTVGNVVVELTEPNWAPDTDSDSNGINDTMSNIVAGQVIAKDPTITNKGDNDAYVYIMVEIPKVYETEITGADGSAATQQHYPLFSFEANDGWSLIDSQVGTEDDAYDYYLYAYDTALTPNGEVTLFDKVKFANITDNFVNTITGEAIVDLDIKVTGYAIQSDYYNGEATDAASAWNLYATQNDWAWPENNYEGISTINFVNEDSITVHTVTDYAGVPVEMYFEDSLAKTGYTFDWVDETTGEVAYSGMPMPKEDTNLTATYSETGFGTEYSDFLEYELGGETVDTLYLRVAGMNVDHENYPTELSDIVIPSHLTVTHAKKNLDDFALEGGTLRKTNYTTRSVPAGTYTVPIKYVGCMSSDRNMTNDNEMEYHDDIIRSVVIPDTAVSLNGVVTNCENVTSIILPYSVKEVSALAPNCINLIDVYIPNTVTRIINKSFAGCLALTDIELPESLLELGGAEFKDSGLTSITIPRNVKSIGTYDPVTTDSYNPDGCFEGCTSLTEVVVEEGSKLELIGNETFLGCTSLNTIIIPDSVKTIGLKAFSGCTGIETISTCAKIIGERSFEYCSNLKEFYAHEGTTDVLKFAFYDCRALTTIGIPLSLQTIGEYAVANCSSIENLLYAGTAEEFSAVSIDNGNDLNVVPTFRATY